MNWRAYPFLRLLIPLLAGLSLSSFLQVPLVDIRLYGIVLIMVLVVAHRLNRLYRFRSMFGWAILVGVTGLGLFLPSYLKSTHSKRVFEFAYSEQRNYAGRVLQLRERPYGQRLEVAVQYQTDAHSNWKAVSGKLQVYLRDSTTRVRTGDWVFFSSRIQPLPSPSNPGAFDYGTYLRQEGVYAQTFLKKDQLKIYDSSRPFSLIGLREAAVSRLTTGLKQDSSGLAIASALVLGDRRFLETELRNDFIAAGAMHILAVSGLHVGIVGMGVFALLSFLPSGPVSRRWTAAIAGIGVITCYALITGGSPSVVRASVMFGLVLLGKAFYRGSRFWNTLAASAFLLLMVKPDWLWQVGFQLSYLAVAGIVYLQPRFCSLFAFSNPVLNYGWQLLGVSVAAQLATSPLSLYYFHQFPVYFWLSGWVAVPLATIILSFSLVCLITAGIPLWGPLSWKLLSGLLASLQLSIKNIGHLPFAQLDGFYPPLWMVFGLYVVAAGLIIAFETKKWMLIKISLALLLVLFSIRLIERLQLNRQSRCIVYQTREGILIDLFERGTCQSLRSGDLTAISEKWATKEARGLAHIRKIESLEIDKNLSFVFQDKYFLLLSNPLTSPSNVIRQPDVLLLAGDHWWSEALLLQTIKPKQILLLENMPYRKRRFWNKAAEKAAIPCWDIAREGAWQWQK